MPPERLPWVLVAVTAIVLSVLVIASAVAYFSVADAHGRASLEVASAAAYVGQTPTQGLLPDGSVNLSLYLTVYNPSSRDLRFNTVIYKAWIEDPIGEARSPACSGRPDIPITNGSRVQCFYSVFTGSQEVDNPVIPGGGKVTLAYPLVLSASFDSARFAVVQNITAFAASHGIALTGLSWNVWVLVSLDILGVPAPTSVSAATYLGDIDRIIFQAGVDLDTAA